MTYPLKNKRILFIAPSFHGLHNKIYDQMLLMGAEVDYFDERPSNSFFYKVVLRLRLRSLVSNHLKSYYREIVSLTKYKVYNYIFVINIEAIDQDIFRLIKDHNKDSKTILYMWDSLEIKPISKDLLRMFDKVCTFDPRDAKSRDITMLDLFYSKEYKVVSRKSFNYDLCFIGTIHGDRYMLLREIKRKAEKMNLKVYFYFFMPSKTLFFLRKFFDKRFKGIRLDEVNFKSLDAKNVANIMGQSNAIIDLSYKDQCGLSMRTFEVLGVGRKLITTNNCIRKYDFFNSQNILILKKERVQIDKDFIENQYCELNKEIHKKYSLESWVKNIFLESNFK